MAIKLHYARTEEGTLIEISDPKVKSRENQIYFCPDNGCNSRVIPKKGEVMQHHFAHKTNKGGCFGFETSLHLLSKDVLCELEEIEVPQLVFQPNNYFQFFEPEIREIERELGFFLPKKIYLDSSFNTLFKKPPVIFDKRSLKVQDFDIILEKPLQGFRPDLTLISKKDKEKVVHIEVAVTHLIEDNKKEFIEKNDLTFLELDMSMHYHRDRDFTKAAVQKAIVKKEYFIDWINIANRATLIKNRKSLFLRMLKEKLKEIRSAYFEFCQYIVKPNLDLVKKRTLYFENYSYDFDDDLDFLSHSNILKNRLIFNYFLVEFRKSKEYRDYLYQFKKENDYWDFLS